jgi:hypothetical protein
MQSTESILYNHYYAKAIEKHKTLTQKLAEKDFRYLHNEGRPFVSIQRKQIILSPADIDTIIDQLNEIKANAQENEGMAWLETDYNDDDQESIMVVYSDSYTITDIKYCESAAQRYTKDSLWRLERQPNSIQAVKLRALIENLTTNKGEQTTE